MKHPILRVKLYAQIEFFLVAKSNISVFAAIGPHVIVEFGIKSKEASFA